MIKSFQKIHFTELQLKHMIYQYEIRLRNMISANLELQVVYYLKICLYLASIYSEK